MKDPFVPKAQTPQTNTESAQERTATLNLTPSAPTQLGHFQILGKLGEGGMGVVYRAHDTLLDRVVALKLVSTSQHNDPQARKRLLREARVAARLDHPNICTVYSIEEVEGSFCIAMQFVEGRTLRQLIAEEPPSLEKFFTITLQIASGLEEAHRRGIVHRDIKSSNIMVSPSGQVKILDFGLSRLASGVGDGQTVTGPGIISGTPAYIAPEILRGEVADARSDVFSLGVVMYEMLAGKLPFARETASGTMHAILSEEPQALRTLHRETPEELEGLIAKALAKDPAKRYASAQALRDDLEKLSARWIPAERRPRFATPTIPTRRWSWRSALAVVLVFAGISAGAVWWLARSRPPSSVGGKPALAASPSQSAGPATLPSRVPVGKPSVAVLGFSNLSHNPGFSNLELGTAEVLTESMVGSGRFRTVERTQLDQVIKELNLNRTEYTDPATAQKIGHLVGAQYLVLGSFQVFKGQVRLDARVLRVETGEIVTAKRVTGSQGEAAQLPERLAQELLTVMP